MLYKEDWEKSKQRFKVLWEREIIDRCCISITSPKKGCNFVEEKIPEKYEDKVRYWTDPEWIYRRNVKRMENTYYGGDAIPMVWLNLGPSGLAAYFGCEAKFEDNTIWFAPTINNWEEDRLEFNPNSELLLKGKEIARYLCDYGKDRFFVSMPDNASALDTLAHIRGTQNILMDFILEPDRLKQSLDKITKVWLDTNEEFYGIISKCNEGGSCIGWLNTWAPGKHSQIQCDLSVMISPELFEEFVMNELKLACDSTDFSLYHLDGVEQIRHLDLLLSLESLDMIQWTSVVGQPPPTDYLSVLKKIQSAGKCLLLNTKAEYIETLLSYLSPKGLYLVTETETEEDARELLNKVEKFKK